MCVILLCVIIYYTYVVYVHYRYYIGTYIPVLVVLIVNIAYYVINCYSTVDNIVYYNCDINMDRLDI